MTDTSRWSKDRVDPGEATVCDGNNCGRTLHEMETVYRRLRRPGDPQIKERGEVEELCQACYARQERA